MKQYFVCYNGASTLDSIIKSRYTGKDPVIGMVYEWRSEYVREPADDDRFIELIVYEFYTGKRVVANEWSLAPVELPEFVIREPSEDFP
jgi:hypothetical protein